MQVEITRPGGIYYYDAYRDGHDTTQIDDLSGTSSASSNKLLISNCDIATLVAVNNQQVEILLSVPVAPVAAQSKVWGLQAPAGANRGAVVFVIADAVFSCKVYKADGSAVLFEKTITWDSDWTATDTRYRISLGERSIRFFIEDECVASFGDENNTVFSYFAHTPLPVRITNGNVDNLFLSSISVY